MMPQIAKRLVVVFGVCGLSLLGCGETTVLESRLSQTDPGTDTQTSEGSGSVESGADPSPWVLDPISPAGFLFESQTEVAFVPVGEVQGQAKGHVVNASLSRDTFGVNHFASTFESEREGDHMEIEHSGGLIWVGTISGDKLPIETVSIIDKKPEVLELHWATPGDAQGAFDRLQATADRNAAAAVVAGPSQLRTGEFLADEAYVVEVETCRQAADGMVDVFGSITHRSLESPPLTRWMSSSFAVEVKVADGVGRVARGISLALGVPAETTKRWSVQFEGSGSSPNYSVEQVRLIVGR